MNTSAPPTASPAEAAFTPEEIARLLNPAQPLTPTAEQQNIIQAPLSGATLVIAGAGSGKTETLANRVVWLVANGLCKPEEILGLTFTVKAAGELNERIRTQLLTFQHNAHAELARLTAAQQAAITRLDHTLHHGFNMPAVSTYNSFAAGVVSEFGSYAGIADSVTLIDEAAAKQLCENTVAAADDPRLVDVKLTRPELVKRIVELEHQASEHLLEDFDRVRARVGDFLRTRNLPVNQKSSATAPHTKAFGDMVKAVTATAVIADYAEAFRAEKRDRGFIEFSDQVRLAVEIVRSFQPCRDTVRSRYTAVLLDEVQDTSVGQTRLLSLLFRGKPVMGVGDPHQTIYAFRGAAADALTDFHRHFSDSTNTAGDVETPEARTLTLSTSWRNASRVLTVANALSAPLREGFPLEVPTLKPRPGAPEGEVTLEFSTLESEELSRMAAWVKQQREELRQSDPEQRYPTSAVLVRSSALLGRVAKALREHDVPHYVVGLGALFETPEVADLLSVLRCVDGYAAHNELVRVLTGPRFGVGLHDIAALEKVARWFQKRDVAQQPLPAELSDQQRLLVHADRVVTNTDVLDLLRLNPASHVAFKPLSRDGVAKLTDAGEVLHRLRRYRSGRMTDLVRACEREMRLDLELGAHPKFADPDYPQSPENAGKVDARANIDQFLRTVSEFERTHGAGDLSALLDWVDRSKADSDHLEAAPEPNRETVQVMTMHRSKGLEWDIVALPNWRKTQFPTAARDNTGWIGKGRLPHPLRGDAASLPELRWDLAATQKEVTDAFAEYKEARKDAHEREERRLAYVAVTRAKHRLRVSGALWGSQQKKQGPSAFFQEVAEACERSEEFGTVEDNAAERPEEAETTLRWPIDALGARRQAVTAAARAVAAAQAQLAADAAGSAGDEHTITSMGDDYVGDRHAGGELAGVTHTPEASDRTVDRPNNSVLTPELELLVAQHRQPHEQTTPPESIGRRVNASAFHHAVQDPEKFYRDSLRPIPQRPYRGTDLGNRFHEWVERRFTTAVGKTLTLPGLFDTDFDSLPEVIESNGELTIHPEQGDDDRDDLAPVHTGERAPMETAGQQTPPEHAGQRTTDRGELPDPGIVPAPELDALIAKFEASRWADRQAVAVEKEITVPFAGERLVCKIDAVFQNDDGTVEIVDWKTGRVPQTAAEKHDRLFQAELYRHAYARWSGIPVEQISASLFYVAHGVELTLEPRYTFAELETLWQQQRSAGIAAVTAAEPGGRNDEAN